MILEIWRAFPIFYKMGPYFTKFDQLVPDLARLGSDWQFPVIFGGVWEFSPGLARYEMIWRYICKYFNKILQDSGKMWP